MQGQVKAMAIQVYARQCKEKQGKEKQGKEKQGKEKQGKDNARQGKIMARQGQGNGTNKVWIRQYTVSPFLLFYATNLLQR